jgi:hypothetical protein
MSARDLLDDIIRDGRAVMDSQSKRIGLLEEQLLKTCTCGCHGFRMVSIHSTRCPYRISLEIVELEVSRGG